jgi:anti-sigma regulatory factor (Ser/Thr protein kinase)
VNKSVCVAVTDGTGVGETRRAAAELARGLGFSATTAGQVSIVATEAASNVLKHGGGGEVLFRRLTAQNASGLEMLCLDRGPGMPDVQRCVEDGYSTAGSPGIGLGAISRLATLFDVYSAPGHGTALLMQLWSTAQVRSEGALEIGAVCVAKDNGPESGDAWDAQPAGAGRFLIMLADGLGHGPLASRAAEEARRVFRENLDLNPAAIIERTHGPLRPTRGAGVSIAELNSGLSVVRYAGVGNIAGAVFSTSGTSRLVALNGTLGHALHQVREFTYPWPAGALLVLHTDGLQSRWQLETYPRLLRHHPALVAGVLYRDFKRGHDDVTVVAATSPSPIRWERVGVRVPL